jgi:nucleotidyltransferase/DNA polymerase involved in DNA repair
LGKDNFILERASIDELFIDVTKSCYMSNSQAWEKLKVNDTGDFFNNTIVYGDAAYDRTLLNDDEKALKRGCEIAHAIRLSVVNELGFTMSAGIASSKTFAKLAATYGKPNGQAVVFPQALSKVRI